MGNFCSIPRADEERSFSGVFSLDEANSRARPAQQPQAASERPVTPAAVKVAVDTRAGAASRPEQPAFNHQPNEVGPANTTADALTETPIRWKQGEGIGAGAFGRVYLGLNLDTGQLMAVKQVSVPNDGGSKKVVGEHMKNLEAEVNMLKELKHPNIVRYMGTERGQDQKSLNIFLEFVPGGSIASLLTKFGSFSESLVRVYTKQILLGLDFLHTHQIMHRDIKGANILVDNSGSVKLADFGASKKIETLATLNKSVKGTPYWMAPEVIKQTGHGVKADIWSVACTVIEMASGKPPWSHISEPVSALFHIASARGPPPLPEHLSPEAKDFLLLCFNRSPEDRPSAGQLLQHPFLRATTPTSKAAPPRASATANSPAPAPAAPPAPPPAAAPPAPPPQFGIGFRFEPAKPLTPVREVSTPGAHAPEDDTTLASRPSRFFAEDNTAARDDTPELSPPPQLRLFGKENRGPGRPADNLAGNKKPAVPAGNPEGHKDEDENIMQYVRDEAAKTLRLSMQFLDLSGAAPLHEAEGPRALGPETSSPPQIPRLDGPSPRPTGDRRLGRPVRPSQTTGGERMSKSQQWKEELEKELHERRLKAKTPRDGLGAIHGRFN